ncbi:hypothetical protein L211DRAFT_290847 [Terfezia boudieri ATCC MYA-4762]|uniref:Uncharacterized protein n=1 Tax=Terfezia boudieri ATCC MYA-4762 TaxID=1051890 RepID=A0A3N4LNX5_9PEZI|nr:hypothetical protein L211DRAFT_290847 [Terfezia boudieri ATCC MYA-4762]
MSEAMITDALHYRTLLFELSKPVTIPAEKFDEIWLYVDSVYASLSGEVLQCKSGNASVGFEINKIKSLKARSSKDGTAVFGIISIYVMFGSKSHDLLMV